MKNVLTITLDHLYIHIICLRPVPLPTTYVVLTHLLLIYDIVTPR